MSPFLADDEGDLRTNLFQEEGNDDEGEPVMHVEQVKVPLGPLTRARAKHMREALQTLVRAVQASVGEPRTIEGLNESRQVTLLQVLDRGPSL